MNDNVSVIIPTYNYGRFISEAVESALAQTHVLAEIIVVDDGSTDNTAEIIANFGSKVKYIRQENAGVCAARSTGVNLSVGEYVAFLDADDIWEPTKIERQLGVFNSDPEVGLVHSGMREFDSATGETVGVLVEGRSGWVADDLLVWEERAVNVSGSSIMVSREAFDSVGGFDSRIKVGEDWDFCYRVARKFKVGFVAEPLVNYRIHSGGAHRNVEDMEKGMGLFYEKAFDTTDQDILKLKNRALSNYHRVLSGSYFCSGDYTRFASHAIRSILRRPINLKYFAAFPFRRLDRR